MKTERSIPQNEVHNVINNIGIPPCPAILTKLVRAMRDDDPDLRKISSLINSDVGLAATMLKTVNSPFYGLRTRASSVSQAVALLGVRNVDRLVTGLLLREAFSGSSNPVMEDFWECSSTMALITAWLAPRVKTVNIENAYTFSLFRDCGTAALIRTFAGYKPALLALATDVQGVLAHEKDRFGIHHASLGYCMAKNWLLTQDLCDAVLHHHDYARLKNGDIPKATLDMIVLALASEWIFMMQKHSTACQGWHEAGEFALNKLGITQGQLDELLQEADRVLPS